MSEHDVELTNELRALGLRHMETWLAALGDAEDLGPEATPGLCLECGFEGRRYVIEGPRCCVAVCRSCARTRRRAAVKSGLPLPDADEVSWYTPPAAGQEAAA